MDKLGNSDDLGIGALASKSEGLLQHNSVKLSALPLLPSPKVGTTIVDPDVDPDVDEDAEVDPVNPFVEFNLQESVGERSGSEYGADAVSSQAGNEISRGNSIKDQDSKSSAPTGTVDVPSCVDVSNVKNIEEEENAVEDSNSSVLYEYDDDDDEEGEWQEMPTVSNNYDVYDDKGEIINSAGDTSFGSGTTAATTMDLKSGASKKKDVKKPTSSSNGYTKIAGQAQAEHYSESDKQTDFLFKNSREKVNQKPEKTEEDTDDEYPYEDDDFMENTTRSALDQMQSTKEMLKEEEIFAYVGLVKLLMIEMATNLAQLSTSKLRHSKSLSASQASLAVWSQRVMANLYEHMDVTKEEKTMIESLSKHGVEPADLFSGLAKIETIDNPVYEELDEDSDKKLEEIKEELPEQVSEDTQIEEDGTDLGDIGIREETKIPASTPVVDAKVEDLDADISDINIEAKSRVVDPDEIKNKKTIEIDVTWTVICDLFLILIYDSVYDSRSRTLLMRFAESLNLNNFEVCQFERRITDALEIDEGGSQTLNESEFIKYRAKKAKRKRMVYIGLAGVGGSLILGVSGGLLGPLIGAGIAAGLSTVGIAGTGTFLAGTAGTAIVTGASTAIGAKVGASGMMRRTGSVKTFEFRPLHNNKRVSLIVTVSGWMNSANDDVRLPFSTVDPVMGDLYSLLWEPEMLTSTGQTINILATEVLTLSVQQILGATVLAALMSAIQIPMALSKLGYILDNPWNVSLDRAWAAGLILADTLISRNLGVRPITLVGFSIGSRLIYSCLLELVKKGAYDLVENVIIFGSPFVCNLEQLSLCRSVVSGKFINGYSKKDWILGYLFRATSGGIRRVVGLSPIEGINGIENFDCTPYVTGHMEYRTAMPKLLKLIGWSVISEEFVEIDEADPEQSERQRELILEFDKSAKQILEDKEKSTQKKKPGWKTWFKPKRKEWWEVYAEGQIQKERKEKEEDEKRLKEIDGEDKRKQVVQNEEAQNEEAERVDPKAEYMTFDVKELKKEIETMKETGELEQVNEQLQKHYEETKNSRQPIQSEATDVKREK